MLNHNAQTVLAKYRARIDAEETLLKNGDPIKMMQRRDEFLLPIGEETANFLHSLIMARKPKNLIELGTSYGYSTLFLADAATKVGGTVTTYELADYKSDYAKKSLQDAGVESAVNFQCGDAVELLAKDPSPIDFVLIDLWKELYIPCFDLIYPRLSDNAIIVADNMLLPEFYRDSGKAYKAAVAAKPDIETVLLPIGSGIELSCVWRNA